MASLVSTRGPQIILSARYSLVDCWGWAIDLFLGQQTREHEDIDIQFLRRDQQKVRLVLSGWDVQEAHPTLSLDWPFITWETGTSLREDVHDIWCRPNQAAPWAIQLMVADAIDDYWQFRRDPRIQHPLATLGFRTSKGAVHIILFLFLSPVISAPAPLHAFAREHKPGRASQDTFEDRRAQRVSQGLPARQA